MTTRSIGDDAVKARTGCDWSEWFAYLDRKKCRTMTHGEIVAVVAKAGAGPWWQQMVTVEYERARGLREKHETTQGFVAGVSRTVKVPLADLWKAWATPAARKRWLGGAGFHVRKAAEQKSLRVTWLDGATNVEILFYDKGPGKSLVTVSHSRLASAKDVAKKKAYWKAALTALASRLEG
jgi:hypothetical protein